MTLRSPVTWFETTHAGMESEPASPILCGVLAPSFQVSMPTSLSVHCFGWEADFPTVFQSSELESGAH